ncbi:hypothetical protein HDU85_006969 [Gaertneriomyces sp. JEL0708]|nr:hypothetical protein HDU85_006969 [Gaertneriomyces sp. JEL0708]
MENVFAQSEESDAVTYEIYRKATKASADEILEEAQELAIIASSYVSQWTDGYIWHNEPFALSVAPSGSEKGLVKVQGKTRFGDAIDDEWFIVFLLRELALHFPDIVLSVQDNDGQFILIEAADHLPAWLSPSTSENRVFIHRGQLHIIPMPRTPAEIPLYPSGSIVLERAFDIVISPAPTEAALAVQEALNARLAGYPERAQKNMHHAKMVVPRPIAHLLQHDPQLVAPAVEAFYTRDPLTMKACFRMAKFPPADSVVITARMNRVQYAQLMSQRFHPPKPFRLPPRNSPEFKSHELGMKLACGFEMLYADLHLQDRSKSHEMPSLDDYNFDADRAWLRFRSRLEKLGYFGEELVGSKQYRDMQKRAKVQFLQSRTPAGHLPEINPICRIDAILKLPIDSGTFPALQDHEDSDDWMEVDHTALENLLSKEERRVSDVGPLESDEEDDSDLDEEEMRDMEALSKMFGGFSSFVGKESGIDGVLFPHENEPDDEMQDAFGVSKGPLQFDESQFVQSMMDMLGMDDTELALVKGFGKLMKDMEPSQDPDILRSDSSSTAQESSADVEADSANEDDSELGVAGVPIEEYMDAMDRELSGTKIGKSFHRENERVSSSEEAEETHNHGEESAPVDLDLNLVKNILESFSAQEGLPGPASSILASMGISLPKKHQ